MPTIPPLPSQNRNRAATEGIFPEAVAARLAEYLRANTAYLRVLASGWETTVFEFALGSRSGVVPTIPLNTPLVLRFYQSSNAADKGSRESRVMRFLANAGYPVPRPYLYEPSDSPLGAPFLIMQRITGTPLFGIRSFPRAFATFSLGFISFVRAQARLHRIALSESASGDFPLAYSTPDASDETPLLDRMLSIIAARIDHGNLGGLKPALDRIRSRAPDFRDAPASAVHMDYHPQNVLVRGVRVTGVIDWVNADRGDRHLDAATTSVILACTTMEHPRWMGENAAGHLLRALFASLYVPLYHAMAPMDFARLRYCQGVAALFRLSTLGMMGTAGPDTVGYRPEAIREVTPPVVRLLTRYASRKIGVPVHLDVPSALLA